MVNIQNKKDSAVVTKASDYFSVNLMTDQFGKISCERIPSGVYVVTTQQSDGSVGEFINQLGSTFEMIVDGDVMQYVPYVKSNKIYGNVVINRDPFSALGYVSPGNIRVTAIDSKGNTYSALTDKEGGFLLFAPQAGLYKVRVNNVFDEKFILRQDEFIVDFKGFKEFKITFLFTEGKRKINFKGDINGFNFADNNFSINDSNQNSNDNNLDPKLPDVVELFDDPALLKRPIMKDMIFFKVQVGAYNPTASVDQIDAVKNVISNVEESPTNQGLTRLSVGEFGDRTKAEAFRQDLLRNEDLPNKEFIIVVGEYFGKFITADEAEALLKSDDEE